MIATIYEEVFQKIKAILELDGAGSFTIQQADDRTRARLNNPPLMVLDFAPRCDDQPEE